MTEIKPYAFSGSGLEKIEIPSSLNAIDDGLFQYCNNLIEMHIDFNHLEEIKQGAFYGTSLNTLYIENCPSILGNTLNEFKSKINFDELSNRNPLELPDYCTIILTFVL